MSAVAPTVGGAARGLPFAGLLLSTALLPLLAPTVWHRHLGKVVLAWSLAFLLPFAAVFGTEPALRSIAHALLVDYLPFVALLTALYATAGGIEIVVDRPATAASNIGLMAVGAALASVVGTTGASMLLIRPLLRANAHRPQSAHVVVFFIFSVANIGGALTPLGDPPLFLGFLLGVGFFWTAQHLLAPMLFVLIGLFAICYRIDSLRFRQEAGAAGRALPLAGVSGNRRPLRIVVRGKANLLPLVFIIGLVLLSGVWKPITAFQVFGVDIGLAQLVRDVGLVWATLLSLAITPTACRVRNEFSWAPMAEVAQLFLGIFVTMIPVILLLRAGAAGPFAFMTRAVTGAAGEPLPWAYFWTTGLSSSFLDNAPTYLVFFELAGGDAGRLMAEMATTLTALSAGAVFMGATSYIGNAPNLMVKAIAERHGVRMPSFIRYLAWSSVILLPLYALLTLVFFL